MHTALRQSLSRINVDNAYNWLKEANIINKKHAPVTYKFIKENADVIGLLFNQHKCDRDGVVRRFYTIYENSKYVNVPIEVIYIPQDETESSFRRSFKEQANWFSLKFDDPLVHELKYMYEVTCLPQLRIISVDTTLISRDGIGDIEQYGQNAVITWLPTSASSKKHRNFKNDSGYYASKWSYIDAHRDDSVSSKKTKTRSWSMSDVEDRRAGQRASNSSKSDAGDDDNLDKDDEEKPFYDSSKFKIPQ